MLVTGFPNPGWRRRLALGASAPRVLRGKRQLLGLSLACAGLVLQSWCGRGPTKAKARKLAPWACE